MEDSSEKISQKLDDFKKTITQAGFKLTPQRIEIFKEVIKSKDHPDAMTVYKKVSVKMPNISLDSVYRSLWLFIDLGLITTFGNSCDRLRFDRNMDPHHHFICRNCGTILDFDNDDFSHLEIPENVESMGSVENIHVEMRGVCSLCLQKRQSEKNKNKKGG
ncbi:MAG: transcriptional repressor [Deltaproteobacteria bacterium]|uniref:Transcriptional repressor n=1 Tax=Candidatus Zymogenus saltonus TaxID=2844893 RepID=A0A9D8KJB7_9DELT|nr:transcriptional repressor [Candidatus Zymogenus saltonus]